MRFTCSSILAAALLAMPAIAIAGPFEDGQAAFRRHDWAVALRDWRPLAEQGSAPAQYSVGLIYDRGLGVPQDYAEAVKWYRSAANQGNGPAQLSLGIMVQRGRSVRQDNVCALMWYNLAAAQGVEYSSMYRNSLERAISFREVVQAQSLSQDWKPTLGGAPLAVDSRDGICPPKPGGHNGFVALD